MDWGSLIGIALALGGILVGQMLEGGGLGSLVQPAAFIIVIVGTIGAVLLQSGWRNFAQGVKMAGLVFVPKDDDYQALISDITSWSVIARREGLLSLERVIKDVNDPFIAHGLRLIVDGVDPNKLREVLDMEIGAYETRQRLAIKIWEAAGGYAPTIGILGAVLGLIHVMENLSDPSRLGSGIAVAFVATIYGVGFANLVFLPISSKLKALVSRDIFKREMLADAFAGIAAGDNPRLIEERMNIYLM
ncbi:flagellar motor protein [Herminiimonas arsenitoxidans]|uniref:flagellar motor protein n=1 Tax=Herminiimonas arsenitoxidans TaxID=1809410 RepID=UPI000971418B|nr:flagellar motor protein [Herminiimonas arsenitoxidans]